MKAASHNVDLLIHFIDCAVVEKDDCDKIIHFALKFAHRFIKDKDDQREFVDFCLEKESNIDLLYLLKLKRYKEAAQKIQKECEHNPKWWTINYKGNGILWASMEPLSRPNPSLPNLRTLEPRQKHIQQLNSLLASQNVQCQLAKYGVLVPN